ncbi:MAG: LCP family protein, partial [Chloroflexi bacterium]|nr:LCP family protein [Chloroflexota bacterium]
MRYLFNFFSWLMRRSSRDVKQRSAPPPARQNRSASPQAPQRPAPPPDQKPLSALAAGALIGFFLLAVGVSSALIYSTVRDWVATGTVPGLAALVLRSSAAAGAVDQPPDAGSADGAAETGKYLWNSSERVTVLVMGIDQRAGLELDTAYRTDTMMLVTLDPLGKRAGMLSIPRDLYVQIPGFAGRDRINTANFKGDAQKLPGGGPALAMETVTANLGIATDYYLRINFTAFEAFIDELGGIELDVPVALDDPTYPDCCYGYDPFYIAAGRQLLDGKTALKYARTRKTNGGDFDRATRQQQVLLAVRDKLFDLNFMPQLLLRAPALYSMLSGSLDTNLSLDQLVGLALLAQSIERKNIQSAVIDGKYILKEFVTADGKQVVALDEQGFRELRTEMFYTPGPEPSATLDVERQAAEENASIEVLNGAAQAGIAQKTADYLLKNGFNVVSVGNADRYNYDTTIIYDYTGRYYTTRWLSE